MECSTSQHLRHFQCLYQILRWGPRRALCYNSIELVLALGCVHWLGRWCDHCQGCWCDRGMRLERPPSSLELGGFGGSRRLFSLAMDLYLQRCNAWLWIWGGMACFVGLGLGFGWRCWQMSLSSPRGARAFHELRRYHTRPSRFNWGPKNVHFGKTHFRDPNSNAEIFCFTNYKILLKSWCQYLGP